MNNLISNEPTMTKEEAIKWLNKNRPCISMTCNKENADKINIATDMAIEALNRDGTITYENGKPTVNICPVCGSVWDIRGGRE